VISSCENYHTKSPALKMSRNRDRSIGSSEGTDTKSYAKTSRTDVALKHCTNPVAINKY